MELELTVSQMNKVHSIKKLICSNIRPFTTFFAFQINVIFYISVSKMQTPGEKNGVNSFLNRHRFYRCWHAKIWKISWKYLLLTSNTRLYSVSRQFVCKPKPQLKKNRPFYWIYLSYICSKTITERFFIDFHHFWSFLLK